jgi:hypothetical protein
VCIASLSARYYLNGGDAFRLTLWVETPEAVKQNLLLEQQYSSGNIGEPETKVS